MIASGELDDFRIIGLTGYSTEEEVNKFLQAGLDDYSIYPFI